MAADEKRNSGYVEVHKAANTEALAADLMDKVRNGWTIEQVIVLPQGNGPADVIVVRRS